MCFLKKKFNLHELLIVIVIISLLLNTSLPYFSDTKIKAIFAAVATNTNQLQEAVDNYMLDKEEYPTPEQPTLGNPQPIDFDLLYPEYLKLYPSEIADYWVDYLGTVYGSDANAPIVKYYAPGKFAWHIVPNAETYIIYEVNERKAQKGITGSAVINILSTPTKIKTTLGEVLTVSLDPQKKIIEVIGSPNKEYMVSAVSTLNLQTAPVGKDYKFNTPVVIPTGLGHNSKEIKLVSSERADWLALSKVENERNENLNYFFASSNNDSTYSHWATSIEDVPRGKYLKIKITNNNTEQLEYDIKRMNVSYYIPSKGIQNAQINLYKRTNYCYSQRERFSDGFGTLNIPETKLLSGQTYSFEISLPEGIRPERVDILPQISIAGNANVVVKYKTFRDGNWTDGVSFFNQLGNFGQQSEIEITVNGDGYAVLDKVLYEAISPEVKDIGTKPITQTVYLPNRGEEEVPETDLVSSIRITTDVSELYSNTDIEWTYTGENLGEVKVEEWLLDGNTHYKAPNGVLPAGEHSISLKVKNKDNQWIQSSTLNFTVIESSGSSSPRIKTIASGLFHAIAITKDARVIAWGSNQYGQMGLENEFSYMYIYNEPVLVNNLENVKTVFAGSETSFAILKDGTVKAWGRNDKNQLGDGSFTNRYEPVTIDIKNVVQIAGGREFTAALTSDGEVYTWGDNSCGQLGYGYFYGNQGTPKKVEGLSNVVKLAVGKNTAYALLEDGTVYGWGENYDGQLGLDHNQHQNKPTWIPTLVDIVDISTGGSSTLALVSDGTVWGLGNNSQGATGVAVGHYSHWLPHKTQGITNGIAVITGDGHSAVMLEDSSVVIFGANPLGQLGLRHNNNVYYPVPITNSDGSIMYNIQELDGSYENTYIKIDDVIYSTGSNQFGQLGRFSPNSNTYAPIADYKK